MTRRAYLLVKVSSGRVIRLTAGASLKFNINWQVGEFEVVFLAFLEIYEFIFRNINFDQRSFYAESIGEARIAIENNMSSKEVGTSLYISRYFTLVSVNWW